MIVIDFTWRYGDEGNIFGGEPSLATPGNVDHWRVVANVSDVVKPFHGYLVFERRMTDAVGGEKWEAWSDRDGLLMSRVLRRLLACDIEQIPKVELTIVSLGEFTYKDRF